MIEQFLFPALLRAIMLLHYSGTPRRVEFLSTWLATYHGGCIYTRTNIRTRSICLADLCGRFHLSGRAAAIHLFRSIGLIPVAVLFSSRSRRPFFLFDTATCISFLGQTLFRNWLFVTRWCHQRVKNYSRVHCDFPSNINFFPFNQSLRPFRAKEIWPRTGRRKQRILEKES